MKKLEKILFTTFVISFLGYMAFQISRIFIDYSAMGIEFY
jgi:hypothetical protein